MRPMSAEDGSHSNGSSRPDIGVSTDPSLVGCGNCGSANPRERKFCSQCGKPLWRACEKCSATNAVVENFCGGCGADLKSAADQRAEQFEQSLVEARRCRADYHFSKALALLRQAIQEHEGHLDGQIDHARQLIKDCTSQRDTELEQAEAHFQRALEFVKSHAYESAQCAIEEIPAALRNEAAEHLLAEVKGKRREILSLGGDIRAALAEKKTLDLMPKLERLIELQPKHEQARQLARQLRTRLLEAARKQISRHRYAEALELLQRVPAFLREQEDHDLRAQAGELAWLLAELQTSPVVDEVLHSAAERLVKLAPSHKQAAALKEQILQRQGKRSRDPRVRTIAWAAPPKESNVGLPVVWLTGLGRLHSEQLNASPAYRSHPGCFFAACGLALQGIDKAPITINLAPQKKAKLAGFTLLKRKKTSRTAWGFDVGEFAVKAVKLRYDESEDCVAVEVCDCVEFGKPLNQTDLDQNRGELIQQAFDEIFEKHARDADRVCVSLSGSKMLGRQFDIPPVKAKKVADAVEFEASHQIPFPLSDLIWDYQLLDHSQQQDDAAESAPQPHVLFVAAKDHHVTDFVSIFERMQLDIDVLQSTHLALHNYACFEFFSDEDEERDPSEAIASFDVGCEGCNLIVSTPERVWFRNVRLGGNDITKVLMRQFKLSRKQAEQLKRRPHKVRRLSQLYDAISPLLDEMVSEIGRSLDMHAQVYPQQKVSRLYALGGGFQLHGMLRHLLHGAHNKSPGVIE